METDWTRDSQSFDRIAERYETYRPEYPYNLGNTLIAITRLKQGDCILEVGSGTGKATGMFAGCGFTITCLEPGKNLSEIAARKFRHEPQISFVQSRFEDWEAPTERFDLLVSAQAYHWVPKDVRMKKADQILKPGGHIALIWNMYPFVHSGLRQDLDRVYKQLAPEIAQENPDIEAVIRQVSNEIRGSGYFEEPILERFPWTREMDTQEYLGLLGTYSDHLRMAAEDRKRLFDGVAQVIDRRGGKIQQQYLAVLHLAKKSNQ